MSNIQYIFRIQYSVHQCSARCDYLVSLLHLLSMSALYYQQYKKACPSLRKKGQFHNRSLFPDLDQDQLEYPDWYIQKCKPMLGKDFLITARNLLTPEIAADLKNLQGFQFAQHPRIDAPEERLHALSDIVNNQIKAILTP